MYAEITGYEAKSCTRLTPGFYRIDEQGHWHKLDDPSVLETFLEAEKLAPPYRGVSRKSFILGFLACLQFRSTKDKT